MADDDPQFVQIEFLTFEDVCEIHDRGLLEFGEGAAGFIDENVVRSAVAQAQALSSLGTCTTSPPAWQPHTCTSLPRSRDLSRATSESRSARRLNSLPATA